MSELLLDSFLSQRFVSTMYILILLDYGQSVVDSHILTGVIWFSHWPEAISIVDISAVTVARVFISNCIAQFGVLAQITTDHTWQFEVYLFYGLSRILSVHHIHMTSSYPTSNGIVEPFHRQLKTTLRASSDPQNVYLSFFSVTVPL